MEMLYKQVHDGLSNDELLKIFEKYTTSCNETFVECRVGTNTFDCCKNVHIIALTTLEFSYWNAAGCYFINVPKPLGHQNVPGTRRSLQITVTRDQTIPLFLEMAGGAKINWNIYLLPQDDDPLSGGFSRIETAPITLEQNTMNIISMNPSFTELLGHPYSPDCQTKPIESPNQLLSGYNIDQCYSVCEMKQSKEQCNCVRIGFEPWPNHSVKLCTPLETLCAVKAVANITCDCPIPCKYSKLHVRISSRNFEDIHHRLIDEVVQEIDNNTQLGYTRSLHMKMAVELFYTTLVTQHIVQSPKWSLTTMLSSIGAQCAFWMGLKIMTFCQLFYHSFLYVRKGNPTSPSEKPSYGRKTRSVVECNKPALLSHKSIHDSQVMSVSVI